jgi:ABC-type dipeptide/oligopeptide/nickel transport system permease component
VFFLIAVFIILSNFFVDVLYGFIDPRVSIDD